MSETFSLHRWLGAAPGPILVLAALNMADEFDRIAFSALSPEIRDRFELSDGLVLMLNVVPGIVILLTAGLVGWLADRHNRILVSLAAAAGWGLASVGTGLAPTLAILIVVRILSGVGRSANEIVHPSLIADLYSEPQHPRAFLIHRLGNPIAQVSGLLAGWIGGQFGWTWAFYLLVTPTILLTTALARMTDPPRRKRSTDTAQSLPLTKAVPVLARYRSFPRLWLGAVFLGAASFGIFGLASLYYEDEFGFGPRGRGFVQFIIGSGWFLGVLIGGRFASIAARSDEYRKLVLLFISPLVWHGCGGGRRSFRCAHGGGGTGHHLCVGARKRCVAVTILFCRCQDCSAVVVWAGVWLIGHCICAWQLPHDSDCVAR
jgi:predicted MFS family arabinose efflux permease